MSYLSLDRRSIYLCFMAINAGPSHEPIQWSCRIIKVPWVQRRTVSLGRMGWDMANWGEVY